MMSRSGIGKKFLVFFFALAAFTIALSGCNFFGKKDPADPLPPGQLADGASIVGTWTMDAANTSATNNPSVAYNTTYVFDAAGNAEVIVQDMHVSGAKCTAFGIYREIAANNFMIFVQGVVPSSCGFAAQITLSDVKVKKRSFSYKDGFSEYPVTVFASQPQNPVVVGLWDFRSAGGDASGEGGIDYLLLDPHGYFLLQSTDAEGQFLLVGYYVVSNGSLSLVFFNNMDPTQVTTLPMMFSQFASDGTTLQLNAGVDSNGKPIYFSGRRL